MMKTVSRNSGFTLVELIAVLVIIAAAAGLVIPAVGMIGRTTDMATSAKTQQDLANNVQEFFLLQKRYPQGVDSLLVDGAHGAGTATQDGTPDYPYTAVTHPQTSEQISGMTTSNPGIISLLTQATLTSNQRRSFTRGGFDYVFDHRGLTIDGTTFAVTGEQNANNSGQYRRTLPASGTMTAAVLNSATATNLAPDSGAFLVLRGLVPSEMRSNTTTPANWDWVPEPGTQLVAVGIGPNCRLVPTTMLNAPTYPGSDGKYYGRYIAVFKVFDSGERCVLVGVTDAYGRTPDYTQQQFAESLPNGARQG